MTDQVWFPFFENIAGKTFLIVGGGEVAKRKVRQLRQFSARVLVIAPETDIAPEKGIEVRHRSFEEEDLERGDYVIAATADRELNRRVALLCREQALPVNVVDDPALCTWQFPALVHRGDLTVGISTGGTSPAYAGVLRQQLEEAIPDNIEEILLCMESLRLLAPEYIQEQKIRRKLHREVLTKLLAGELDPAEKPVKIVEHFLEQELLDR